MALLLVLSFLCFNTLKMEWKKEKDKKNKINIVVIYWNVYQGFFSSLSMMDYDGNAQHQMEITEVYL